MKFTIERDELLKGLRAVQGVIERRTTIPILGSVLIESVQDSITISATDQELGVRRTCEATIEQQGALVIAGRKFAEIIRECQSGPININTLKNNWVEISSGTSRFKIVGLEPKEFPAMPTPGKADQAVTLPTDVLRGMITATAFAVCQDDFRANLCGTYVEQHDGKLRMVTTDGHRLAIVTRPMSAGGLSRSVLLPRKGVVELVKMLDGQDGDVTLTIQGNVVHVDHDHTYLTMRLVEGEFPDYRQVVPSEDRHARKFMVSAGEMLSALRRMSLLSQERSRGVKVEADDNKLSLSSVNPDLGEACEELAIEYPDAKLYVGLNAKYPMDMLSTLADDEPVTVGVIDDISPVVMRTGDPDYLYVVMPMRLN